MSAPLDSASCSHKSTFNPLNSDNKYLEVFKNMVFNDLNRMRIRKVVNPQYIRKGMSRLRSKRKLSYALLINKEV